MTEAQTAAPVPSAADATSPASAVSGADAQRSPVWNWWNDLDEDRGGRAELRRCGTVAEVAFTPAYHGLLRWLGSPRGWEDTHRIALVAAVLSHVKEEPAEQTTFASLMGTEKTAGQGAAISDARFRQLIRGSEPDELMRDLIRVVRQLGRRAPIDQLAGDLRRWTEAIRMRWARDYYEAVPTDPKKT